MKLVIKSSTISLLLMLLIPLVAIGQDQQGQQKIAKEFLNLIELNSFTEAASLFHYPKSYATEEKESEFTSVKDGLQNFKKQVGSIIEIINYIPDGEFIGSGVSGADIEYWTKKQQQSPQIIIPCKFQNIELGVIRILFCNFEKHLEIRSVDFSFVKTAESEKLVKNLSDN